MNSRDSYGGIKQPMRELRCVVCGQTGVSQADSGDLICTVCGTLFPVLSNISVMLSQPLVKVAEEHRRYESAKAMVLAKADMLESFVDTHPQDSATPRIRRMAAGIRANQGLADEVFRPLGAFMADYADRTGESLLNILYQNLALGYDFDLLLAYLYQDWAGDKAFSAVRERILQAIEHYPERRRSALVLGSGTGGVVHALADVYPHVSAVDLSMTAHLLAQRMLDSREELAIFLFKRMVAIASQNGCVDVRLAPPHRAAGSIQMLCADASRLPQVSGETSLVVTQYLLDLVPDPERIVREIHRVLEEDGLWINFGLPFGRTGEETTVGSRDQHELGEFFREHGFDVREMDRGAFNLLDRTAVLPDSTLVIDHPLFFVARKIPGGSEPAHSQLFFDFFSGRNDAVLSKVPVLQQDFGFTESHIYGASDKRAERKFWMGSPGTARAVPEQIAGLIRSLLENLNHGLTIGQLAPALDAQIPGAFPLAGLVETFRFLSERKIVNLR